MAGPDDWVAIAFHTAPEDKLQDGYWDDEGAPSGLIPNHKSG
jgi:hypothetical protein